MELLPQILVNGLLAGSVIALIALGLNLVYGVLRFMNFAHGEMAMVGAFIYYAFFIELALPIVPSVLATVLLCGLLGLIFHKLVFQPIHRESQWTLLITSIGVSLLVRAAVLLLAGGRSKNYAREGFETQVFHFWDDRILITDYQIVLLVATLLLLGLVGSFLKYSKMGKAIRAVSDSPSMASLLGIPVNRIVALIFFLSAALAGFAGILIGYEQNLSPSMGLSLSIFAFAAVILGGLGNVRGAVLGGFLLGILQNLLVGIDWWGFSIPTSYKNAVAFAVLILMLIVRPRGLLGISLEEEASRK